MMRVSVNFAKKRLLEFGNKRLQIFYFLICCVILLIGYCPHTFGEVKQPNVSGAFYPADPKELSQTINRFIAEADPPEIKGDILVVMSPHAGYEFSGRTAAHGYKIIQGRGYDTVIVLASTHYFNFRGAALWPKGAFSTPLGDIPVDESASYNLMLSSSLFSAYPEVFDREHSIEVELPFLQVALKEFKIVPVIFGQVDFSDCQDLAAAIAEGIKDKRCLLVVSTDMYHGFDYKDAEIQDAYTLNLIKQLKTKELYDRIQDQKAALCGWSAVIISMLVADELGFDQVKVLSHTSSAQVTNSKRAGEYCVGYGSVAIYKSRTFPINESLSEDRKVRDKQDEKKGGAMLNEGQRKRLLEIARKSIKTYLKTGKKLEVTEEDSVLLEHRGAFVTLHKDKQLRGCIGNIVSGQALYLTVRDMAIEAAVNDPRFVSLTEEELADIKIEVSALSPLKKAESADEIELGKHGVIIRKEYRSGVFLPQVAQETGWSKEEFLSNLCAHKAGLPPLAWKDPTTEIHIFTAEVFSE